MENNDMIIAALKSGNLRVFNEIYHDYYKGLCMFCSQYIPMHEAEDIVQETFIWLWEKRKGLNERFSLKGLLFTIVKNKTLNCIHRTCIRQEVIQKIATEYTEKYESYNFYESKEFFYSYQQVMSKLSPVIRKTFIMHRFRHLTYKEIAEEQGCSIQAVNYRINRAVKIIKSELMKTTNITKE